MYFIQKTSHVKDNFHNNWASAEKDPLQRDLVGGP